MRYSGTTARYQRARPPPGRFWDKRWRSQAPVGPPTAGRTRFEEAGRTWADMCVISAALRLSPQIPVSPSTASPRGASDRGRFGRRRPSRDGTGEATASLGSAAFALARRLADPPVNVPLGRSDRIAWGITWAKWRSSPKCKPRRRAAPQETSFVSLAADQCRPGPPNRRDHGQSAGEGRARGPSCVRLAESIPPPPAHSVAKGECHEGVPCGRHL